MPGHTPVVLFVLSYSTSSALVLCACVHTAVQLQQYTTAAVPGILLVAVPTCI